MAYIIATAIEKGGVAKTTTAIHMGVGLANRGIATAIVDLDPQTNATQWLFGDDYEPTLTMYDVLADSRTTPISKALVETRYPGLSIVPGDRGLGNADDLLQAWPNKIKRDPNTVLRTALAQTPEAVDVVIIDCPPSVGILNANAIIAADHLLIPIRPAKLSFNGFLQLGLSIQQLMEVGGLQQSPDISVVFAQIMARRKKNERYKSKVLEIAADAGNDSVYVCDTSIRYRGILDDLPDKLLTCFDPKAGKAAHEVRDDYLQLLDEFMTRVESINEKKKAIA